jgi:hypothetical protein
MVSKCANTECGAPFQYLREGRLFKFEVGRNLQQNAAPPGPRIVPAKKGPARVEHFWLCGRCSQQMTLRYDMSSGVIVIPLQRFWYNAAAS